MEKERQKLERGEARLGIMTKAHEGRLDKINETNQKLLGKMHDKDEENKRLVRLRTK
jgi:hypothetical protein